MALEIEKIDLIVEGTQVIRRGAGYVWDVDITARKSGGVTEEVTAATLTIVRQRDEEDVTADFVSGSVTFTGQTISLPAITAPAAAEIGNYIATVEYTAGGFVPDRPAFNIKVTD